MVSGAVNYQHGVTAEPFTELQCQYRGEVIDDPVGRGLGHPEQQRQLAQGQVGPPVPGDQQDPVLQRQSSRPALVDRSAPSRRNAVIS